MLRKHHPINPITCTHSGLVGTSIPQVSNLVVGKSSCSSIFVVIDLVGTSIHTQYTTSIYCSYYSTLSITMHKVRVQNEALGDPLSMWKVLVGFVWLYVYLT